MSHESFDIRLASMIFVFYIYRFYFDQIVSIDNLFIIATHKTARDFFS